MIGQKTFSNKVRAEDIACIIYGRLGFSIALISERTGLSKGAVNYRLKLMEVHIKDYRNGHTPLSQRVIEAATADSVLLIKEIRDHIKLIGTGVKDAKERTENR